MNRGDEVELHIEKFADRGKSLARSEGYVIFVAGAVPGDRVMARVVKRKKKFAEASLITLLEPSPLRTEPRCVYFGTCGGCKWQHVSYEAQLEAKRMSVEEALVHHGGFSEIKALPTIGNEQPYYYRNKMEFSFSAQRWLADWEIASGEPFDTSFALGLHVPGNYSKVLDLRVCYLQSESSVRIVNGVREFVRQKAWTPWDVRAQTGYLRHLVIRTSHCTDDLMVNLITSADEADRMEEMAEFMRHSFPEVTTFVNTVNTGVAQVAFGDYFNVLYGDGVIRDRIGTFSFEIAPNAFFQTNTGQAERLYEVARDFASLKPDDLVYDLYCGAGSITIFVAPHVRKVIGVELVEEAVENARANAVANGIDNCTFLSGDLMRLFTPEFAAEHGRPDVLIADPPRAGMHKKVVEQIALLRPERFIYVSCNPMTQARDLAMLREIYEIEAAQPVDMFPQTFHTENVVKLRAKQV